MKKVIVIAVAILVAYQARAQNKDHRNKISYGIDLGINYSALPATANDPINIKRISTGNEIGFRLGLLAEMPFSKHWSVIANPALSFYGNKLNIIKADNTTDIYEIPPMIELAAHIKYNCSLTAFKPYFLVGPGYKIPLVSEANKSLQFASTVAAVDAGIGIEKKYAKFIMAPEIRYSRGLSNMGTMPGIGEVSLHTLSLVVKFRGI